MITDVEYYKIISEYYDLSDYKTKRSLVFCNEAQKMSNIEHIVAKLYNHIKTNCTGIDFGTIPKSKGVITRVENYQQVVDCLNTIRELVVEYNENPKLVDSLFTAIDNIQKREASFVKAFALNIEIPIMFYNMTVMSIIAGTSLLISTSIEYVKNGHDSFSMSFDKSSYHKSQNHVLYQYAEQFNRECANGHIDKVINDCIKNNATSANMTHMGESANLNESLFNSRDIDAAGDFGENVGIIAGTFGLVKNVIMGVFGAVGSLFGLMRMGIYYFLRMRMNLSDWFNIQANFLQINADNLKYRDGDDATKKNAYQKQMKWVERFRKLSNAVALKDTKAQKESKEDEDSYSRKRKYDENDDNSSYDNDGNNNGGGLF